MPPRQKPSIKIDEDGDGDTDVTIEVDTPDPEPGPGDLPANTREILDDVVIHMEIVVPAGTQRLTYAAVRETLRGLLNT